MFQVGLHTKEQLALWPNQEGCITVGSEKAFCAAEHVTLGCFWLKSRQPLPKVRFKGYPLKYLGRQLMCRIHGRTVGKSHTYNYPSERHHIALK